ncbi:MAG: ATP-dependent DNA helicase [Candidatus Nanoarchaeia archaeon]|nr:ATP-dependent DNA helicase [Candidatus Nanoarchaeia archaeon]
MTEFNTKQKELINNLEGIYVVDAGAGTGKTTTIINRYIEILKKEDPKDVFLVTFTKNAASDMKDKVLNLVDEVKSDYKIMTFHSFCNNLLKENSVKISKYLEIDDFLLNYELIENDAILEDMFFDMINSLNMPNSYKKLLDSIEMSDLYNLIKKIASKGIIPSKKGWFLNRGIDGDRKEFIEVLQKNNIPPSSKKHSKIKLDVNKIKKDLYNFNVEELIDNRIIKEDKIIELFDSKDKEIDNFIHYIYREQIKYLISNNVLDFDTLLVFTFVLLYKDKEIRDANKFNYIIIDEFQDTNDLQFMISLLLLKKKNLMVVGDWKQSIYGFRNANVENIVKFENKIEIFSRKMNLDEIRFPLIRKTDVKPLFLEENYRSSKEILDLAHQIIQNHNIEDYKLVQLKHNQNYKSKIEAFQLKSLENEYNKVVNIVIDLITNKELESKNRKVKLSDICILTRTKSNARDIQKKLLENNIPSIFEGGANIYRSDLAILLLNYLKLFYNDSDKNALVAIYEYEGIGYEEIKEKLKLPINLDLISDLSILKKSSINKILNYLIKKYDIDDIYSNTFLIHILNKEMDTFDLIKFIENNIKKNENTNLLMNENEKVTIQTIHKSKGLEYPVVIISNINTRVFPSSIGDSSTVIYNDLLGVRLKKEVLEKPYYYIYENPSTKILQAVLKESSNDEELRLFYVAITRAKEYLYFTSHNPSKFFDYVSLIIKPEFITDDIIIDKNLNIEKEISKENSELIELKTISNKKSVHDEMGLDDYNYLSSTFGSLFHEFSDLYIKSKGRIEGKLLRYYNKIISLDDENKILIENYKNFISNYDFNKISSEEKIIYNLNGKTINGIIDIIYREGNSIDIIDIKTDKTKKNLKEYKIQLEIYKNAIKEFYENKKYDVKVHIYWLRRNELEKL